jgi:signal transduction histidine kinase
VEEVVREAVDATSQLFREKSVQLSTRVAGPIPRMRADRDRVMQVLVNLLANAVKFSPPDDGRVEVRVSATPGSLRVDVHDNGMGIAPADQEWIFEKFRQVGDGAGVRPQGTGLGLPISKRIIEHLGGRLWVESDRGRGATFSFVLPLEPRTPAVPAPVAGVAE